MSNLWLIFIVALIFAFFDWHARAVFIAAKYCGCYHHGRTWNRAHKHYKTHWTLLERLLWLPVFKEKYDGDTRLLVYFSYIHLILAIAAGILIFLGELVYNNVELVAYSFLAYLISTILRWLYTNALGRGDLDKI